MYKWYVLQVMSGREKKVKTNLEENREANGMDELVQEVVVPTENVIEVKQGEQKVSEKRLWPGYVLIKMNLTDEAWIYVKNTNDVIDFIGGGKPVPLSDEEVNEILQDLRSRKDEVVHKHQLAPGDRIKITDGVFVNFTGSVLEVFYDKGRLSAMVLIFGRETRIDDLEFWQVEELTAEADV